MFREFYAALVKNRKRTGEVLLAMIVFAQLAPQVRAHENVSLALGIVAVGLRQAGANKSDPYYRENPEKIPGGPDQN